MNLKVPWGVTSVTVKLLTGPGASSFEDFTWAGVSWTFANNGRGTQVAWDTKTVQVRNGIATVSVGASEAILVVMN